MNKFNLEEIYSRGFTLEEVLEVFGKTISHVNLKHANRDKIEEHLKINYLIKDESLEEFLANMDKVFELTSSINIGEKFTPCDLYKAIKFVGYVIGGVDISEAYYRVNKYIQAVREAKERNTAYDKERIKFLATNYSVSKLVMAVHQYYDYPMHILFRDIRYDAIQTLKKESKTASLSRDRIAAADKLLVHLSPQQTNNVNINITNKQEKSFIEQFKEEAAKLAMAQQKAIESNPDSARDIINAEIEEVKPNE